MSVKAMGRWLRYFFGPNSPLGPGMSGVLSVITFALAVLILAPIVVKAAAWWWSIWLP